MITYLIQVTVCMAVFYAFYWLALRKETFFQTNRFYLLSSLFFSLVFPLIRIYIDMSLARSVALQAPVYIGSYMQNVEIGVNASQKGFNFSWQEILLMIYGAGVILLAIRFFFSLRAILLLKSKAIMTKVEDQICALSPQVKSPFSFLSLVYLPEKHSFSAQELKEVICHERAHVEGGHSIDVILLEILSIFLWPNPLVYFYKKSLKEIHEFIADAAVVKKTDWAVYGEFLIQQKEHCFQGSLISNQLIYSQLKNRLIMMTQQPSSWLAKCKYSGVLPILLLALLVFSFRPKEVTTPVQTNNASESVNTGSDGNTEKPIFPGCEKLNLMEIADCTSKSLYQYVADHLKYPEEMIKAKQEGKVYVGFEITKAGLVANAKIKMTLNPAADKAALDVVNGMNDIVGKWTPGTRDGVPVNMEMTLPISFALETESLPEDKPGNSSAAADQSNSSDEPLSYVEHMPTFPGGADAMYKFIYERIKYPAVARDNGIQGIVIIQFVVAKDGTIQNAKAVRGIGGGCNEEALRVVNEMPKWNPGQHEGKNVAVQFTLPIKFVLQAKNPDEKTSTDPSTTSPTQTQPNELEQSTVVTEKPVTNVEEIQFSPNPASDHLTIELFDGAESIIIYNAKGSLVIKKDLTETANKNYQLDISSLPGGVFTILVTSNNESRTGSFTKVK